VTFKREKLLGEGEASDKFGGLVIVTGVRERKEPRYHLEASGKVKKVT